MDAAADVRLPCVSITPLGAPVEPDVYTSAARSGSTAAGDTSLADVCVHVTCTDPPGSRAILAAAPLSASSSLRYSARVCGLTMKKTPPALRTPNNEATASIELSRQIATRSPG